VVVTGYYKSSPELKELLLDKTITGYGRPEKKTAVQVYDRAEVQPEPVNGMSNFQQYLRKNIQYPRQVEKAVQGKVWVKFVVHKDGSLTDISVVKSLGTGYDEEAIRLIAAGPAWNPGKQQGESVAVQNVMPISFGKPLDETSLSQLPLLSGKLTESQPAPVEGFEAFYKKIGRTILYPSAARAQFAEGQVWVQFTVNPDGSLSQVEVIESLHPELDQEVIRVVSEAGLSWKPAVVNGQAKASKLFFPVSFILGA
jgi:protein TonB